MQRTTRSFTLTLTAEKICLIALLVLSIAALAIVTAGCTSSQKASVTKTLTGYTDPNVTDPTQPTTQPATQPTSNSVEGMTLSAAQIAAIVAAIPSPGQPIAMLIAAAMPSILVLERLFVRVVQSLPNSDSSGSSSASSGTAQPAAVQGVPPNAMPPSPAPGTPPASGQGGTATVNSGVVAGK